MFSAVWEHLQKVTERVAAVADVEDIAFDPDGIQDVINQVDDVIDAVDRAKLRAERIFEQLRPPGDYAGDLYVENVWQHARDYRAWAVDYTTKLERFAEKLEKLKRDYEAGEEEMAWGFDQGMQA